MTKKAVELPSNYIPFIPKWVFDTSLSGTDLRLYLYILYKWRVYSYHSGVFCESITTIAEAIGCADRSVKSSLQKLENKKIISIRRRSKAGKKDTSIITPLDESGDKMIGRGIDEEKIPF